MRKTPAQQGRETLAKIRARRYLFRIIVSAMNGADLHSCSVPHLSRIESGERQCSAELAASLKWVAGVLK